MDKVKAGAVIVAAGSSSRMGTDKLLAELCGIPVLVRTLLAFEKASSISEVVVVTRAEKVKLIADLCQRHNIAKVTNVIVGGETRNESAVLGIEALSAELELACVHDGARPLILSSQIDEVMANAQAYGASILAVPSKDTVKIAENSMITSTPERSLLYNAQTPQAFQKSLYLECINKLGDLAKVATDDSIVLEMAGQTVHITNGSYENIKITTPEDMIVAEAFLERGSDENS